MIHTAIKDRSKNIGIKKITFRARSTPSIQTTSDATALRIKLWLPRGRLCQHSSSERLLPRSTTQQHTDTSSHLDGKSKRRTGPVCSQILVHGAHDNADAAHASARQHVFNIVSVARMDSDQTRTPRRTPTKETDAPPRPPPLGPMEHCGARVHSVRRPRTPRKSQKNTTAPACAPHPTVVSRPHRAQGRGVVRDCVVHRQIAPSIH